MKKAVPLFVSLFVGVFLLSGCSSVSGGGIVVLFAGNAGSPSSISAFTDVSGSLTAVTGSPFTTSGNAPLTLVTASRLFLYAASPTAAPAPGGIILMPIHADGSLGAAQLQASGGDYDGLAVTSNGKFLYAADVASNEVKAFSINAATGALTGIGTPQGVGPDPFNLIVDPQGKFLFVANCSCTLVFGTGSVSVFSIGTDGTLTAVAGSPFLLPATAQPTDAVVSPDGTLLFVSSINDNKVYVEKVAANGALSSAAAPVSLPAGSNPLSVRTSADGKTVYTANAPLVGDGNVSVLSVGAGGALADKGEVAAAGSPALLRVDPSGGFLYVTVDPSTTTNTNSVIVYSIAADGTLTQKASVSTGGPGPFGLAFNR